MSDHPETALLQDYVNNSDAAEFRHLRLHLAQCADCRSVVHGLTGLHTMAQQSDKSCDTLTEQQQQQIADYIDDHATTIEQQLMQDFIQTNPAATKAALHYASHRSAMDKAALKPVASVTNVVTARTNIWNIIVTQLKNLTAIQSPVWLTVPATAALVTLISINVINQPAADAPLYAIAHYQDNAIIQYRDKTAAPGIGFFAHSSQSAEPYDAVTIALKHNNQFHIQWPPVANALHYTLRLQMFNQGSKTVLGEITTDTTSAVIMSGLDNVYHRYEWVLTGETRDNRSFISSGGFVISKPDTGVLQ